MHGNQRQTQLSYIAGVLDSDGCFMITRHKRKTKRKDHPHMVDSWAWTYLPSIKISMIEPQAIDFVKKITGIGTISIIGTRPSRPKSKPLIQWGVRKRDDIKPFLEEIIPFLKVKKKRAEFLLEYCMKAHYIKRRYRYFGLSKEELKYREDSYQKMRELNGTKVAAETKSSRPEKVCDSPTS